MPKNCFHPDLFAQKVILITGGGSGIGFRTACDLAELGAIPILLGRNSRKLKIAAEKIHSRSQQADFVSCDIAQEEQVCEAVRSILIKHGRIDGLVNNAGGQFASPLSRLSKKGFETVVQVNLIGGFVVAREVYNQYMAKNGGSIVNIVADMWEGFPGNGHSGAARAGMANFTKTAALEWGRQGVRVNAVSPGIIRTKGFEKYYPKDVKEFVDKVALPAIPLQRYGDEEDVSSAIIFFLSDASRYISGECMKVNGGTVVHSRFWPFPDIDLEDFVPVEYLTKDFKAIDE